MQCILLSSNICEVSLKLWMLFLSVHKKWARNLKVGLECSQSICCYVIAGNLEQPTVMAFRIEDKSL